VKHLTTCFVLGLTFIAGLTTAWPQPALPDEPPPSVSNSRSVEEQLRELRYDQVACLVTHNAMSSQAEGWFFPNQSHGLTRQLEDGVRGLMLDVHTIGGQPWLVHNRPILGKRPLVDALRDIARFMKSEPQAVVTIIFESYVPSKSVQQAFRQAGLLDYAHQQKCGDAWPTLNSMVQAGKRLVVFTDRGGGEWPGYHAVWDHCQETHFSVRSVTEFSFRRNRGQAQNSLLILNHFLTAPIASRSLAKQANAAEVLSPRIRECEAKTGRFPKFIAVDFHDIGQTVRTVRQFNLARLQTGSRSPRAE
jgi:hypothetical protein